MKKNENNKIKKASADGGNNSIKIVMENGDEEITYNYPNLFLPISTKEYSFEMNETLKDTEEIKRHLDVTVKLPIDRKGTRVIFGDHLKINNDPNSKQRSEGNRKATDKQLARNIITSFAATEIANMSLAEFKNIEEIRLNISVGLPINEYKEIKTRELFIKSLLGTTEIEFNYPSVRAINNKINIIIESVNVEVEGLAAFDMAIASSSLEQRILSKENLNRIFVMLDIGNHTIDGIGIKVINYNGEISYTLSTDMSTGILGSVNSALQSIISRVEKENNIIASNGKKTIAVSEITEAYLEQDGFLSSVGINIKDIYEEEMESLGIRIAEEFIEFFNDNAKGFIDTIFLTGGGSLIKPLVKGIKDAIKDSYEYSNVKVETFGEVDPVYANAFGYYISLN